MKHFYHPMSRALTTHWMLTELGAEHEQIVIDFMNGENATPQFKAINPMGKIPVLQDGDTVITETAAICAYLADKYPEQGLAPSPQAPERGAYYRYMFFPGMTLEPMFTNRQLGITDPSPASTGWGDYDTCLATIETMVPDAGWALGPPFTAADVVFGGFLDFAIQFGWLESPTPKVASYVRRIKARPAYRESHDPSWH